MKEEKDRVTVEIGGNKRLTIIFRRLMTQKEKDEAVSNYLNSLK